MDHHCIHGGSKVLVLLLFQAEGDRGRGRKKGREEGRKGGEEGREEDGVEEKGVERDKKKDQEERGETEVRRVWSGEKENREGH